MGKAQFEFHQKQYGRYVLTSGYVGQRSLPEKERPNLYCLPKYLLCYPRKGAESLPDIKDRLRLIIPMPVWFICICNVTN